LYSLLISNDKKAEIDRNISMVEYLASFWNAEAVRKIQDSREMSGDHNFKNDEEFESFVRAGEYKNNPLIDAIVKLKNMENKGVKNQENGRKDSKKIPTDLSSIYRTLGSFNKGE
jgi:hypothetical protein